MGWHRRGMCLAAELGLANTLLGVGRNPAGIGNREPHGHQKKSPASWALHKQRLPVPGLLHNQRPRLSFAAEDHRKAALLLRIDGDDGCMPCG